MKYLKKFENQAAYGAAESGLILPNVSLCVQEGTVFYKPVIPPYQGFCKLTLNDNSVIELEGSGELTKEMTSGYSANCVSVEVGQLCTSIGYKTFSQGWNKGSRLLSSITISDTVTSIGNSAFTSCSGVTTIIIPSSVTIVGRHSFYDCANLTSVTIYNGITEINDDSFNGCEKLTEIIIPNSVERVGNGAFQYCSGLTNVTIGSSVTFVGAYAFDNCSNLLSITCLATTPPGLGAETVFNNIPNECILYVPTQSVAAYQNASVWKNLTIQPIP